MHKPIEDFIKSENQPSARGQFPGSKSGAQSSTGNNPQAHTR